MRFNAVSYSTDGFSLPVAQSNDGKMGLWMTGALVIGSMISSGIFLLPGSLAPLGRNAVIAILAGAAFVGLIYLIARRLRRGRPVFAPDKEHIHHRLREIGHTHRQAVLMMYFWSLLLAGSALAISFINGRGLVAVIVGAALLIIAATFIPRRIRETRRQRRTVKAAQS